MIRNMFWIPVHCQCCHTAAAGLSIECEPLHTSATLLVQWSMKC